MEYARLGVFRLCFDREERTEGYVFRRDAEMTGCATELRKIRCSCVNESRNRRLVFLTSRCITGSSAFALLGQNDAWPISTKTELHQRFGIGRKLD